MNPDNAVRKYAILTLSLLAATCCLLITFADHLDPDQDRHNTDIVIMQDLFEKLKNIQQTTIKACKIMQHAKLIMLCIWGPI